MNETVRGRTVSDLIAKYIELRDRKAELEKGVEQLVAPIKADMDVLENVLTQVLMSLGEDEGKRNISIPGVGTVYRQQWTQAKVADPEVFWEFVINGDERQFITNHVSKDAVQEWLDTHNGALPPGIDWTTGWKTLIRKA